MSASTTIGSPLDGNHNSRNYGGTHTGLTNRGQDDTVADQKEAHNSTKTGAGDNTRQGHCRAGMGSQRCTPPRHPLISGGRAAPPLLDGGQGKIISTAGGDGGERATDDGLQWTVADDGDRVDDVRTLRDNMTAIRDCFDPTNASCKLNSVDLPQSETSPTHSSVVPPSGDLTVNGVHPPPSGCPLGQGRGCCGEILCTTMPTTRPQQMGDRPLSTAFNRPSY